MLHDVPERGVRIVVLKQRGPRRTCTVTALDRVVRRLCIFPRDAHDAHLLCGRPRNLEPPRVLGSRQPTRGLNAIKGGADGKERRRGGASPALGDVDAIGVARWRWETRRLWW